ncbi:MAG: AAA domain-containing protein [Balneolaceae bacterium]|nr:AAA domain-containing protein [Balneolaceae bacterium]
MDKSVRELKWYLKCSQDYNLAVEERFFDHFEWQQDYRSQSDSIQKIISTFLEQEVDNWEMQFKEFYINKKLKENFSSLTGGYESQLERLREERKQLINEIKKRIPRYWKAKQTEVNQRVNIRKLYNKRGSKGSRRNSLRKIAKRSFESLTSYFPVMMVSPSVCASMFDLEPNLFDYVVFDEASQLKTEESLSTLIRGKRKIVSGDDKQMPPSYWFTKVNTDDLDVEDEENFNPYQSFNEELQSVEGAHDLANSESLLHFAELCNFQSFHLDFHYRSRHPLLIEFSNAAFYKSRLNPLPEKINQSPIQFIPVNGINHNQQNKDEANSAVEILKNLKRGKEGKLPTVGIATFNKKQKNLVWDVLKRETQTDEDFNRRFREYEENGLFVKNLENIQGDERDIIILSTTFGKGRDGSFSRFYGPLNTSKLGQRLLNVIITRAKKKIFVLTSVPKEYYMNYRQELGQNHEKERGYFHAYLAYAKAVSDGDRESVQSILSFLKNRDRVIGDSDNLTESPFEEAVYQALQTEIDEERISLQHKAGGFRIDIAIKSKKTGREFIAIECDGAAYHSSAEDHAWDMYRQDILEDNKFVFHRIWSRDWWENPDRELEQVVNFIREQDKKDPGHELFDDPAAEDLDLAPLLEETGLFIEEEPKDEKETIEEPVQTEDDTQEVTEEEVSKKMANRYTFSIRLRHESL